MYTHRRELAGPILKALGGAAANQETRTDACEQAHEPRHQTKEGDDEVEEREAGPAGAREHRTGADENARRQHGQGKPGGPPPIVLECGLAITCTRGQVAIVCGC